jgi:hypothetical protein
LSNVFAVHDEYHKYFDKKSERQGNEDVAAPSERVHPWRKDTQVVGQDRKSGECYSKEVCYPAFEDVLRV